MITQGVTSGTQVVAAVSPTVTILLALIAVLLPISSLIIGYLQWKTMQTTNNVAANVDGKLSAVQKIANDFATEVIRLQEKGTSTPFGEPTADSPVTLSAGMPVAMGSAGVQNAAEKDAHK